MFRVLVQIFGEGTPQASLAALVHGERTALQIAGAGVSLKRSWARLNCPLLSRCIRSTPAIVIAAFLKLLKPGIVPRVNHEFAGATHITRFV